MDPKLKQQLAPFKEPSPEELEPEDSLSLHRFQWTLVKSFLDHSLALQNGFKDNQITDSKNAYEYSEEDHSIHGTHRLLAGQRENGIAPEPYELLERKIRKLFNGSSNGTLGGIFNDAGLQYQIFQTKSGGPIKISISPNSDPNYEGKIKIEDLDFEIIYYPGRKDFQYGSKQSLQKFWQTPSLVRYDLDGKKNS